MEELPHITEEQILSVIKMEDGTVEVRIRSSPKTYRVIMAKADWSDLQILEAYQSNPDLLFSP